jgi:uncharacterized membrane protein
MKKQTALWLILGIALFGMAFSALLTYQELFAQSLTHCGASFGAAGQVFGIPACVYGFVMYLLIVIIAALGLRRK